MDPHLSDLQGPVLHEGPIPIGILWVRCVSKNYRNLEACCMLAWTRCGWNKFPKSSPKWWVLWWFTMVQSVQKSATKQTKTPKKGLFQSISSISIGNTSSNHWFSGDQLNKPSWKLQIAFPHNRFYLSPKLPGRSTARRSQMQVQGFWRVFKRQPFFFVCVFLVSL